MSDTRSVIAGVRYGHTNLIARDWRLLADPEGNIVELQSWAPAQ